MLVYRKSFFFFFHLALPFTLSPTWSPLAHPALTVTCQNIRRSRRVPGPGCVDAVYFDVCVLLPFYLVCLSPASKKLGAQWPPSVARQ